MPMVLNFELLCVEFSRSICMTVGLHRGRDRLQDLPVAQKIAGGGPELVVSPGFYAESTACVWSAPRSEADSGYGLCNF